MCIMNTCIYIYTYIYTLIYSRLCLTADFELCSGLSDVPAPAASA